MCRRYRTLVSARVTAVVRRNRSLLVAKLVALLVRLGGLDQALNGSMLACA
jgi:hypothetical protein